MGSMWQALTAPGLMSDLSQYVQGVQRPDVFPMYQPRSPYPFLDTVWKPNLWDRRQDGTMKREGFLGSIPIQGGKTASEYSIGVNIDGKDVQIPALVPNLTQDQLDRLQKDIIPNRRKMPDDIVQAAVANAQARMAKGMSPFYEPGEQAQNSVAGWINNLFGTRDRNRLKEAGLDETD